MASIYDITGEFALLWDLMEEGDLEDDALLGAFDCTREELAIKLEGYCKVIKNIESEKDGIAAEIERLTKKKKAIENNVKRLKSAMLVALKVSGEKKVKCGTFSVSYQANPPSVALDESYLENIPERYLIPQEPTVNKKLILEDLKNGVDLEGVAHLENNDGLRIR